MDYRWNKVPKASAEITKKLQQQLGINSTLCELLTQRGIHDFDTAKTYFRPDLKALHDPFLIKDMDKAVARVEQAIQGQERIFIYGDYNVDGTTAVSLLHSFLKNHYHNIDTYIPDRYK